MGLNGSRVIWGKEEENWSAGDKATEIQGFEFALKLAWSGVLASELDMRTHLIDPSYWILSRLHFNVASRHTHL